MPYSYNVYVCAQIQALNAGDTAFDENNWVDKKQRLHINVSQNQSHVEYD